MDNESNYSNNLADFIEYLNQITVGNLDEIVDCDPCYEFYSEEHKLFNQCLQEQKIKEKHYKHALLERRSKKVESLKNTPLNDKTLQSKREEASDDRAKFMLSKNSVTTSQNVVRLISEECRSIFQSRRNITSTELERLHVTKGAVETLCREIHRRYGILPAFTEEATGNPWASFSPATYATKEVKTFFQEYNIHPSLKRDNLSNLKSLKNKDYETKFLTVQTNFHAKRFLLIRSACSSRLNKGYTLSKKTARDEILKKYFKCSWFTFDDKMRYCPDVLRCFGQNNDMGFRDIEYSLDERLFVPIVATFISLINMTRSPLKYLVAAYHKHLSSDPASKCYQCQQDKKYKQEFVFHHDKEITATQIELEYPAKFGYSFAIGDILFYRGKIDSCFEILPPPVCFHSDLNFSSQKVNMKPKSRKSRLQTALQVENCNFCTDPVIALDCQLIIVDIQALCKWLEKDKTKKVGEVHDLNGFAECVITSGECIDNLEVRRCILVNDIISIGDLNVATWPWIFRRCLLEVILRYDEIQLGDDETDMIILCPFNEVYSLEALKTTMSNISQTKHDGVIVKHSNSIYVYGNESSTVRSWLKQLHPRRYLDILKLDGVTTTATLRNRVRATVAILAAEIKTDDDGHLCLKGIFFGNVKLTKGGKTACCYGYADAKTIPAALASEIFKMHEKTIFVEYLNKENIVLKLPNIDNTVRHKSHIMTKNQKHLFTTKIAWLVPVNPPVSIVVDLSLAPVWEINATLGAKSILVENEVTFLKQRNDLCAFDATPLIELCKMR